MGKLATVIDQIEHGHHVFRAYFKSGFLKQYDKFLTFLRNELVSNNLTDFGLRKGLDHLDAVRTTFQVITDRLPIALLGAQLHYLLLDRNLLSSPRIISIAGLAATEIQKTATLATKKRATSLPARPSPRLL